MIGKKFKYLTVIDEGPNRKDHKTWKCKCVCGNISYPTTYALKSGNTGSCGCKKKELRQKSIDNPKLKKEKKKRNKYNSINIGDKYNKLTVLTELEKSKNSYVKNWLCVCDCGKEKIINDSNLKSGRVKSCGCIRKELKRGKYKKKDI